MSDPLAHLIHAAGRRELPPPEVYERALAAATQTWQAKLHRDRWRKRVRLAAGVAALAVSAGVTLHSFRSEPPPAEPVANVARVIGTVEARASDSHDWLSLHAGAGPLLTGVALRTETASAVALQVEQTSLRIAADTELVLESKSRLRLIQGKVYIDTGADGAAGRMLIVTAKASVSDVGTQFEVEYRRDSYRVRVREGEVLLQHGAHREQGSAGEQISIDATGVIRTVPFAGDDPAWRWTQALASAPDIDNQPLTTLLAWVARETGAAIRYATPAIERQATSTILHGSVRNLEPLQALTVMMATTDLRHEVLADGTIMIQ